ncbi:MAG: phenylacetate--CoA ligase family protein [Salinirussus sp.]
MYDEIETASRSEIRDLQNERLAETVRHAYESIPFYREHLDDAGVSPAAVDSVDALEAVPFTTKAAFREEYPTGLVAVDDAELRRIHASSGTTGKSKIVAYTAADLDAWAEVCARSLSAAGVRPGETVQNACGYGLFTGGIGWHQGAERLGTTVVPAGAGGTGRQIELIRDLGTDSLVCMPSYALYLAETVADGGGDPAGLPLSTVPVGAEPSTAAMRREIADRFGAVVTENYGLSELFGPGVATECATARDGMHLWEDHFYPEVVDPETGDPVTGDEPGELVLTSLTKEALPVLRYRTGDLVELTTEPCECGRTHARISMRGRTDSLLIVRGVNVYPTEVESVLLEFDGLLPQYRIDLSREEALDRFSITAEYDPDAVDDAATLRERLAERLRNVLGLSPDALDLVPRGDLDRTETGKVQRVYDHRE